MNELLMKYQSQLRLMDWDITYIEVPTLSVSSQTKLIFNDYKAVIEMRAELSEIEKEKTLIHELLHLIFRDAYDIFSDNCSNKEMENYCSRQHERAIEKTAQIIYGLNHKEVQNG